MCGADPLGKLVKVDLKQAYYTFSMGEKCICGSSSASWAKIRAEKFHCGADMIAWVLHRAGLQDQNPLPE